MALRRSIDSSNTVKSVTLQDPPPTSINTIADLLSATKMKNSLMQRTFNCECAPDFYNRVLGPTADEAFLRGIHTIFDIFGKFSTCGSEDDYGKESEPVEMKSAQKVVTEALGNMGLPEKMANQVVEKSMEMLLKKDPSLASKMEQTSAINMVSEILQTMGLEPEMVSEVIQTMSSDLDRISMKSTQQEANRRLSLASTSEPLDQRINDIVIEEETKRRSYNEEDSNQKSLNEESLNKVDLNRRIMTVDDSIKSSLTNNDSRKPSLSNDDSKRPSLNKDDSKRPSLNKNDSRKPSLTNEETKNSSLDSKRKSLNEEDLGTNNLYQKEEINEKLTQDNNSRKSSSSSKEEEEVIETKTTSDNSNITPSTAERPKMCSCCKCLSTTSKPRTSESAKSKFGTSTKLRFCRCYDCSVPLVYRVGMNEELLDSELRTECCCRPRGRSKSFARGDNC